MPVVAEWPYTSVSDGKSKNHMRGNSPMYHI